MKRICLLALTMLLIFGTLNKSNVFAENEDNIELTGIACQYTKSYIPSYLKTNQYLPATTAIAINNTNVAQKQTISKSRTVTYTGNVGVKAERDLITSTIGISAEVEYGTSTTTTHVVDVYVPANTTYYVEIGSYKTTTSGVIKTINTDCSTTSSNNKKLEYTSGPYAKWYQ